MDKTDIKQEITEDIINSGKGAVSSRMFQAKGIVCAKVPRLKKSTVPLV